MGLASDCGSQTCPGERQTALSAVEETVASLSRLPSVTPGVDLGSADSLAVGEGGEGEGGGAGGSDVVEECGPVEYSEGEEEEEEEGFRDADMDELAYEGDPLLYSDGEEGTHIHAVMYGEYDCDV